VTGSNYDFAIVGGGLHGCVIALALAAARPTARVVLIERDAELAGNHTWCLHADDVPAELADVIAPAIAHRWDGYRVAFVDHERALASPYVAVTSASLARTVRDACARSSLEVCTGLAVRRLNARRVVLADGRAIDATTVIDARGPDRYAIAGAPHGYQKFVGLELALARPHGLTTPMLMDARVPQSDGFRFFYVLPLAPDRVLVEDTYYSDDATLDRDALTANVHAYADAHGFAIDRVIRREAGVLPLPLASTFDAARAMPVADHPLAVGYHAGWFHPTTGYSFPLALRVAALIANAGAVVYPSVYEGFGLVPFESALAGVPCLFAAQSSLADATPAGTETILQWDAAESAARAHELLSDPGARAAQVAALAAAARELSWDRAASAMVDIYREAAAAPPREAATLSRDAVAREARLTAAHEVVIDRLIGERRHAQGMYDALNAEVGSGLSLIGPNGSLPDDLQRALLGVSARPRLARALFGALARVSAGGRALGRALTGGRRPSA